MSALVSQAEFVKMVIAEESKITTVENAITLRVRRRHRQFINDYTAREYSNEMKKNCLQMYVNGLGFWAIERVTGVNHNTVIRWVRASSEALPDAPIVSEIPEITEIDELYPQRYP